MFRCVDCNKNFVNPTYSIFPNHDLRGNLLSFTIESYCPECGGWDFVCKFVKCLQCGDWVDESTLKFGVCPSCQDEVNMEVLDFLMGKVSPADLEEVKKLFKVVKSAAKERKD